MEEMEGDGGTVSSGCWIFTLPSIGVSVKDQSVLEGERMRQTHEERHVGTCS